MEGVKGSSQFGNFSSKSGHLGPEFIDSSLVVLMRAVKTDVQLSSVLAKVLKRL